MDENLTWHREITIKKTANSLERNRFKVITASNASEVVQAILSIISKDDIVGIGGSQTIVTLGLPQLLEERGHKLAYSKPGISREESLSIRRGALNADVYLASPNAVTRDGKLLFMESIGNRAAGMMFGPRKVIAVAGFNKITDDEAAARARIKTLCGPVNAKRLKLETPCAVTGVCSDCDSPQRICNIEVMLHKSPKNTDYCVILTTEDMGY